jgi:hypothetical protein
MNIVIYCNPFDAVVRPESALSCNVESLFKPLADAIRGDQPQERKGAQETTPTPTKGFKKGLQLPESG